MVVIFLCGIEHSSTVALIKFLFALEDTCIGLYSDIIYEAFKKHTPISVPDIFFLFYMHLKGNFNQIKRNIVENIKKVLFVYLL